MLLYSDSPLTDESIGVASLISEVLEEPGMVGGSHGYIVACVRPGVFFVSRKRDAEEQARRRVFAANGRKV